MEWLTSNEAAAYLKIKPRTLVEWVRTGKVPGHRLSGTRRFVYRFLQSELDAMLTADSLGGAQNSRRQTSILKIVASVAPAIFTGSLKGIWS